MITRRFEFSEGTSNKFWAISIDGRSHTVNFGRIGTAGQTQTAEFASDAEAQKSYNKLVADKMKKGYVEKGANGGPQSVAPVAPVHKPKSTSAPPELASPAPQADVASSALSRAGAEAQSSPSIPIAATTPTGTAPAEEFKVRRDIDLDISAFSYLPSRRASPTPIAPAAPFDLEDCLSRLRTKVRVRTYGWDWDFSRAIADRALTPEEAEFWLTVMTIERKHGTQAEGVAEMLSKSTFEGQLPSPLDLSSRYLTPHAVQCLAALVSTDELCEFLLHPQATQGAQAWQNNGATIRAGFRRYVLPYLDDAAIAKWRAAAKALWDPSSWPTDFYRAPSPFFYFGAMLGLHDEVRSLVEQWPDDLYVSSSWDHTHYHRPQEVVFGAGSAEQVAYQFRRLKLPTGTQDDILTFVALTNVSALDVVANTIAKKGSKDDAEQLFEAFTRLHYPDAAPHALDLMLSSKAPRLAREWLENNLDEAIVGLMPVAAGTGKLTDAAIEFLNSVKRRGHAGRIAAHLGAVEPDVAARVRAKVLDVVEAQLPILSRDATPMWWTEALAQAPLKKSKPVPWALPADLPTLSIGESALGPDHITELLGALQASTLETPHPLLRPLREHAAPERLDAFGWKLVESWIVEGAPSKEKWAFLAAGFLGGDRTVLKLAPMVREWPGESQHQRAVLGLEVLRTIGTDTALMQINGIAQKVKFKGLKERAVQCMDAIAASRSMTRAQLEDRIVPDCGLDERGERIFDFGPRQFRFVLGSELKPMIRYPDGAAKADLPKPGAKDDATKAEAAVAEWKLLKKQISDVAKIQAVRLEQAMVTGRRWTGEEFDKLLVHHPLMLHLVRRLVWASYGPSGAVVATFRVTEDQTLGDVSDQPFTLPPAASVGVLHPLQLAEHPHVLEQWGQLFGDYEIVPPFAQLGRPAYRVTPEQADQRVITHFEARGKLPAQSLVFGLEKLGWQRGVPADAGWVGEHSKQFYGANVTAIICYEEGFSVGYWEGAEDQTIKRVLFLSGLYTPQMYPEHKDALRLTDVDPIALSEVLGDCELLLAKAK
jgi:predicted DNA-binding WGR domain protein